MNKYFSKRYRLHRFLISQGLFFEFIGRLIFQHPITFKTMKAPLFKSSVAYGATLVIPFIIIGFLTGFLTALAIYLSLSKLNLQNPTIFVIQFYFIHAIIPFFIAYILAVQKALNLLDDPHPIFHQPAHQLYQTVITPTILASIVNASLLYFYLTASYLTGIYMAFNQFIEVGILDYLVHLSDILNEKTFMASFGKTIINSLISAIIVAFYYLHIEKKWLTLKKAVAKILIRSFYALLISTFIFQYAFV